MPLPERKRFRIKDLAERWAISEEDVREEIRAGHFKNLIVSTDGLSGTQTRQYCITDTVPPSSAPFSYLQSMSSQDPHKYWLGYIHSIEEFPWPSDHSTLYIPRAEVDAFEKKYKIRPALKPSNGKAAEIVAHAGLDTASASTGDSWKKAARLIGAEILKKHHDWSLERIAKEVHKKMNEKKSAGEPGMTGRGNKIPQPETIRRHALKGIKK